MTQRFDRLCTDAPVSTDLDGRKVTTLDQGDHARSRELHQLTNLTDGQEQDAGGKDRRRATGSVVSSKAQTRRCRITCPGPWRAVGMFALLWNEVGHWPMVKDPYARRELRSEKKSGAPGQTARTLRNAERCVWPFRWIESGFMHCCSIGRRSQTSKLPAHPVIGALTQRLEADALRIPSHFKVWGRTLRRSARTRLSGG